MRAPSPSFGWQGLYLGGHVGYGAGTFGRDTQPLPSQGVFFPHSLTGMIGGYQAGYNWQLSSNVIFGLEADISFTSPLDRPPLQPAPFNTTFDYFGTARGRIGYAFGTLLPYITGGLAFAGTHVDLNDATGEPLVRRSRTHLGWAVGTGVEVALRDGWSAKLEYTYLNFGVQTYGLADLALPDVRVAPDIHTVRLGLNYKIWDARAADGQTIRPLTLPEGGDWNVHGQTTLIAQGYPSFRSPYQGPNSLPGGGRGRETWTVGAFLGWRLWEGGELYFGPELAQGFGIGNSLGLAGFSNGEAQKGGAEYPKFRPQRYFFRQTFGLGGEQETVADAINQLPGKRDVDRITINIGRFAVGDFFDGNSYAKDPRVDFLNWSMWAAAGWDFPADLPGMTRGAVIELNRKDWAIRAGAFQVPSAPNSDVLTFDTGGVVVEFEERHTIFGQPGKLRVGVFANRGNTANYRETVALAAIEPELDIDDIKVANRRDRSKYGVYANLEQQIITDVGLFARASWNDGRNEILSFTDIDRSISGGLSIKGSHWGRPMDTWGIGGAVNGLSQAHREFLAAGATGLLIGDGRLNYAHERIFETFYSIGLWTGAALTADYQFITNPAYNADRGPVSIFTGRFHAEF
ncbi:carbohydrate porin [Bradyrhizobium sp. LHD-71]|nr:carbohydrate porin [Bradyrhizobium sp. LHD-71]MDQ8726290.1 carbohydrate porin [Bradyrhizobium sp. LHD-71]